MSLSRYLYHNVVWKGLYYFAALCLNILIARNFQADGSGSAYYLISIFALVHLLSGLSLESGLTYFGAKRDINSGKLLLISFIWTLVAAGIIFVFTRFFQIESLAVDRSRLETLMLLFVMGNMLSSYGTALFFAQNNFIVPNFINLFVTLLLITVLPYGGHSILPGINVANYFDVYFSAFLLQGLLTIIAFLFLKKEKSRLDLLTRHELRKLIRFSLTAWIGNIIFFLLYRVDYWFVERYCSAVELGNYIQVSKLAQLFFLVPAMFAGTIFPLTAAGNRTVILEWLSITSRIFILVYSVICLVLVFTGDWLFPLIFGKTFTIMHPIFILFIPGILCLSTLYTVTAFNGGNNHLKRNFLGSLYALILVIVANSLLVPKYGVLAAASICSAGYIFYWCYLLYHLRRSEHIRLKSFFVIQPQDWARIQSLWKRNTLS